jgi:hypothetical protein
MGKCRKLYSNLRSKQQKKRRRITYDETTVENSENLFVNDDSDENVLFVNDDIDENTVVINNNSDENVLIINGDIDINLSVVNNNAEYDVNSNIDNNENFPVSADDKVNVAVRRWSSNEPSLSDAMLGRLLRELNTFFPTIPLTARTFSYNQIVLPEISEMWKGRYAHVPNWLEDLKMHLSSVLPCDELNLILNIDGIPLFNDPRRHHAYPILLSAEEIDNKIFCAGLYVSEVCGSNKMPPVNLFLCKFVEEMSVLLTEGITVEDNHIKVNIKAVLADAPARADLKNTNGHNDYYSCERCTQKGNHAGHVVLDQSQVILRTEDDFLQKLQEKHHRPNTEMSLLMTTLNIDPIAAFPLDYMHLVCLGVMKRLMQRWKGSRRKEKKVHLDCECQSNLNNAIKELSMYIPSEFSRRMDGGIQTIAHWKAVEFRFFLLYAGVVILSDDKLFSRSLYFHFLKLCVAMRMLLMENQKKKTMMQCNQLLISFFEDSKILYGLSFISYNVHSLIHIVADYQKFGELDKISCFKFESYLGKHIKGCLRGKFKPLEQIAKRVSSENSIHKKIESSIRYGKPIIRKKINDSNIQGEKSFKSLKIGSNTLKSGDIGQRDNCVMLKDNKIAIIRNILEGDIVVQVFKKVEDLFTYPVPSSEVGIFRCFNLSDRITLSSKLVKSKVLLIPRKKSCIAVKIIHDIPVL